MKLKLTCKETTLIIVKESSQTTLREILQMRIHLWYCKYCTLFFKQNRLLNRALPELARREEAAQTDTLTPDEKNKIKTALTRDE